jgi:hypothetical protein
VRSLHPLHLRLVKRECRLLWAIQQRRDDPRSPLRKIAPLISARPLHDVCLVTPVTAAIALCYHPRCMFWCLILAYAVHFSFEQLAASRPLPRPDQLDGRLKPAARTTAHPFSQEAYSAAVVFGFLAMQTDSSILRLGCATVAATLGASRVLAVSHFPHQVVWGWLAGVAVPHLCDPIRRLVVPEHFSVHNHNWPLVLGTFALLVVLAKFAIDAENQDNPYVAVEKAEYKRVLKQIYMEEVTNVDRRRQRGNEYGEAGEPVKDSFVNLLENIERRESKYRFDRGKSAVLTSGGAGFDPSGAKFA